MIDRNKSNRKPHREWTADELAYLQRAYSGSSNAALSIHFNRPVMEIEAMALELALSKNKRIFPGSMRMPRWTAKEIELLHARYPVESNVEIARLLGRSAKGITNMAHRLGLHKDMSHLVRMGSVNGRLRRKDVQESQDNTEQGK